MSFYDDASLVVIPSAQKTSKLYAVKPTDGSGDLTFTRTGDTATRVNSAGLIEKVRTNLLTYSNTFSNAAWLTSSASVTSGQSGYDGTLNAWLLTSSFSSGFIYQNNTIDGINTFSIYCKAGTNTQIILYSQHATQGKYFDLSSGTVGANFVAPPISASIENVGAGWYRCSIVVTASTNAAWRIYNVAVGTTYIQNAQAEKGDVATAYIPTTTAAVSVGPVANVPRLDYLGSTCPRLILEGQRTNLVTYSEQLDNAAWNKSASSITANNAISPDGYINADLLTSSGPAGYLFPANTNILGTAGGGTFAYSVYLKAGTASSITLLISAVATYTAVFNLSNGTATTSTANTTASIISVDNGWYRCIIVCSSVANSAYSELQIGRIASGLTFYVWGAQLELGAYATSYIPTLAASVTRVADQALLNNSAALPTAYPFTLFAQINYDRAAESQYPLCLIDSSTADTYINIGLGFVGSFEPSATIRTSSTSITVPGNTTIPAGNNKLAIVVTSANIKIYANGALLNTGTNTLAFNSGMNDLLIGQLRSTVDTGTRQKLTQQVIVFKSALTDAQAIELTTL